MKPSTTALQALESMNSVETNGDLRRIVGNMLLGLVRKEVSATDVEAAAKGLDAISNSLNAEIKVARTQIEMREKGGALGTVTHLGQLVIGNHIQQPPSPNSAP